MTDDPTAPELEDSYLDTLEPAGQYTPKVPTMVRDVAYYIGLGVSAIGLIITNSAAVLLDDPTAVVVITGNVVSSMGLVAAGLGVAYRPGKAGV